MKKTQILAILFLTIFATCCAKKVSYNYPDNQDYARNSRAGTLTNKDLVVFGGKETNEKKEKVSQTNDVSKSALWKASTEVIGSLFPIAIIDSDSGIIASEWYQESANSAKRVKINALVRASKIKEENLRISVFRQIKIADGSWQGDGFEDSENATSSDALTAKLIKEKILEKANKY